MADPQHIEWLLEGVERWNARRQQEPFIPFLMNADLYNEFRTRGLVETYGRIQLRGIDLSNANLVGANLRNIDFYEADLRRAKLTANLDTVKFDQADLTDAQIMSTYAGNAVFGSAILRNADLIQTNLADAELAWSQLWTAKLFPEGGVAPQFDTEICQGHPVTGVSSFLNYFENVASQYDSDVVYYFRGESKVGWDLRPSVMRPAPNTKDYFLRPREGRMLTELLSRRPEEFANANSALSQWVIAQHHGLKTRFLDITSDPLVALFNASTDENNRHVAGVVHIFAVPRWLVKPYDDTAASVIANFAKLNRTDQNTLLTKTGTQMQEQDPDVLIGGSYREPIRQLFRLIREEKPWFEEGMVDVRDLFQVFAVQPQQSIERIRAQSGAFLVSAFHERFERDEVLKWNSDTPIYAHYTITIPPNRKDRVVADLHLLRVTRERLFPGLDSSANAITGLHSPGV